MTMKKIQIGNYIRFTDESFAYIDSDSMLLAVELDNENGEVKGCSRNIIDLVEVGDYVNGEKVEDVETFINDRPEEETRIYVNGKMLYNEDIESILSKDRFENISFKARRL